MQTPNTPRGRETERRMLLWRKQNPAADPSAYNRKWDSVYRSLEGEFSDVEDRPQRGFLDDLTDTDRRILVHQVRTMSAFGISNGGPKKRVCKANYPATKGAFGKPKHLRRR